METSDDPTKLDSSELGSNPGRYFMYGGYGEDIRPLTDLPQSFKSWKVWWKVFNVYITKNEHLFQRLKSSADQKKKTQVLNVDLGGPTEW